MPHEWLKIVLKAIGTPKRIRKMIGALVKKWRTHFSIGSEVTTENVKYKRGIFQGDSLSPLPYCLSVSPLYMSYALNQRKGVDVPHTQQQLTHLVFVDSLKLYASCPRELARVIELATEVSEAIGTQLGLKKCAQAHFKDGGKAVVMPVGRNASRIKTLVDGVIQIPGSRTALRSECSVDKKVVGTKTDQKNQGSVEHKAQQCGESKANEQMGWCNV